MRTTERLRGLKAWVEENLCEGRRFKAPAPDLDITKIVTQQPKAFLGWAPTRLDKTGQAQQDPFSVVPGILIMPDSGVAKRAEEKRFDQRNGIRRPKELGQKLTVTMLFSIYEPGIRLPGFIDSAAESGYGLDTTLLAEGTEQGLCTLLDWMDDAIELLLGQKFIPHTDLFLDEETLINALYADQKYISDRRPLFYGFLNMTFDCYANEKPQALEAYLN